MVSWKLFMVRAAVKGKGSISLLLSISFCWILWISRPTPPMESLKIQRYECEALHLQQDTEVTSLPLKVPSSMKRTDNTERCVPPNLPLFTKLIEENRPQRIPDDLCDRRGTTNWLQVSQSRILVKPQFAGARCSAEPIVRLDDDRSVFGGARPISNGSELPSVGFRATCTAQDGRAHKSVYYGIRTLPPPTATAQHRGPPQDNIIILGLDSLSRLETLRSLHRATRIMHTRLAGVTLMQYNIMGDGTPAALLPILTGVREQDMPESRKGFKSARHVDQSMRWIFQDLRDLGYVTLYGEEENQFGTFQLRFLGFKDEPVDFYLRPVLMQQEPLQTDAVCIGNEMASARMLNVVKDLFTLHPERPKFAFVFFATLSHENKDLTPMDSQLTDFLDWFVREDLMRNTSIILMSDHGQRHGPMRNSMQGKLEESLPLMSISLSQQLIAERSAALPTLTANSMRLSTPLDIHRTLLSIARVRDPGPSPQQPATVSSYSLIDHTVAESRTCSDAGIPTHWCSCLRLTTLSDPHSHELTVRAAAHALHHMNMATQPFRHLCVELSVLNVTQADISLASTDLAKRERRVNTKTAMAFNVESKGVISAGFVSLRFITAPNNGLYDATVQFSLNNGTDKNGALQFQVLGEPSRINRYGSQANCIVDAAPHLRKYCFCNSFH